jgi:hypothetical protein
VLAVSKLLTLLAGVLGLAALNAGANAQPSKGPNVVELYTSQGCSSCPPADALLGSLAKRSDVVALTFAVDYWDYLGWKDTLALPENAERQRAYARTWSSDQVYTPQMVINGMTHAVGSQPTAVERAIESTARQLSGKRVPILARADSGGVVVDVGGEPHSGDPSRVASLVLVAVQKQREVSIRRGENGGRSVTYANVVRSLMPLGKWSGQALSLRITKPECQRPGVDLCVVLLQQGNPGAIVGAVQIDPALVADDARALNVSAGPRPTAPGSEPVGVSERK